MGVRGLICQVVGRSCSGVSANVARQADMAGALSEISSRWYRSEERNHVVTVESSMLVQHSTAAATATICRSRDRRHTRLKAGRAGPAVQVECEAQTMAVEKFPSPPQVERVSAVCLSDKGQRLAFDIISPTTTSQQPLLRSGISLRLVSRTPSVSRTTAG